jgi:gliding motility-associated-like protein
MAQTLAVNAGSNTQICPGTTYGLGGTPTASGGTPPYTYAWSPSAGLSSTSIPNPIAAPSVPTWYYLTVTDANGNTAIDSVGVDINPIYLYNAGNDTDICIGGSATLGGANNSLAGNVTYTWTPSTALDNPSAPQPVSTTTNTITYSVTISSPSCPSKNFDVVVTVHELPTVTVCCPATILEGAGTILTATGGIEYYWGGGIGISNTAGNPVTVEPLVTTQYFVYGTDQWGCIDWDTVTVTVIPSDELTFYNTFSPNNDGINDYFYIGNIAKYPQARLEVYTRTGQLVYAKTGYDNSWDGTNYGDKLPEATYYYRLDPGNGSPVFYKSVTIVR